MPSASSVLMRALTWMIRCCCKFTREEMTTRSQQARHRQLTSWTSTSASSTRTCMDSLEPRLNQSRLATTSDCQSATKCPSSKMRCPTTMGCLRSSRTPDARSFQTKCCSTSSTTCLTTKLNSTHTKSFSRVAGSSAPNSRDGWRQTHHRRVCGRTRRANNRTVAQQLCSTHSYGVKKLSTY